jgi:DNA ligase-4
MVGRDALLGDLYMRLSARDAKWLTRLVLKNYLPVVMDTTIILRACHPLLPVILKVQDDLTVAAQFLQDYNGKKGVTGEALSRDKLAQVLRPTLGVKVGRQTWFKGRSIKHCLDMSYGRISCEDKLDGEYCQIHIDLSRGRDCLQIFSKSGKDSTKDRIGLHGAIRESLQLGKPTCPLKNGCILEGELVVYSDREDKIMDFHKIRKYVSRSGSFLGTDEDSQPHPWEHLMIVYYDVLMIDDESLLGSRQSDRFKRLTQLITCKKGHSALVKRRIIDCRQPNAASDLRRVFAECIVARGEGLVLKADDPYFDFSTARRPNGSCCIKLKKEYIGGFGDVGDFAVVGAGYEATKAKLYGIPHLKWTHFFIGCLENKEHVRRWKAKPSFTVTNVVELNATQLKFFKTHVNPASVRATENESISLQIPPSINDGRQPAMVFTEPPVFDIRCFSFEKPSNARFWSPRFPMVTKIHCDRTYVDTTSFAELQDMARLEKESPAPEDSQELLGWIAALEQADPGGVPVDHKTQTTVTTTDSASLSSSSPSKQSTGAEVSGSLGVSEVAQPATADLLMTPPPSSAAQPPEPTSSLDAPCHVPVTVTPRKRPPVSSKTTPRPLKVQRVTPGARDLSQRPSLTKSASQGVKRKPLADITSSSQPRDTATSQRVSRVTGVESFCMPSPAKPDSFSSLVAASFHTVPDRCDGSQRVEIQDSQSPDSGSPPMTQSAKVKSIQEPNMGVAGRVGGTQCIYCPGSCALEGVSILLSPCVAHIPWLTADLLTSHGVTDVILDPEMWKQQALPLTSSGLGSSSAVDDRKLQRRKLVLVEGHRKQATESFFRSIEAAGLQRRNGQREYIAAFDWRVVEELTTEEAKHSGHEGKRQVNGNGKTMQRIWQKHRVGYV